jgi:hypothetical protein
VLLHIGRELRQQILYGDVALQMHVGAKKVGTWARGNGLPWTANQKTCTLYAAPASVRTIQLGLGVVIPLAMLVTSKTVPGCRCRSRAPPRVRPKGPRSLHRRDGSQDCGGASLTAPHVDHLADLSSNHA